MIRKTLGLAALILAIGATSPALAANYVIDSKGAHASINFKIKHLGYSWLVGRFDNFSGTFAFNEKDPTASSIKVEIETASVNSNHAERDKHLRGADFLNVTAHPKASFESTSIEANGNGKGVIKGKLTLNGVTKEIAIDAERIGGGDDPWGGYRQGFSGTTKLSLADFGINYNLGPKSKEVELNLNIEGIRQ